MKLTADQTRLFVNLALGVLEVAGPVVAEHVAGGEISVEEQTTLMNRMKAIVDGSAFTKPHWVPES